MASGRKIPAVGALERLVVLACAAKLSFTDSGADEVGKDGATDKHRSQGQNQEREEN
jgi:hypothetical protein